MPKVKVALFDFARRARRNTNRQQVVEELGRQLQKLGGMLRVNSQVVPRRYFIDQGHDVPNHTMMTLILTGDNRRTTSVTLAIERTLRDEDEVMK